MFSSVIFAFLLVAISNQVKVSNGQLINLALYRPAWQSSQFQTYPADGANDGVMTSYSHTAQGDYSPWWAVDLGKPIHVHLVNVISVIGFMPERLNNFRVGLTNNPPATMSPITYGTTKCGDWQGAATGMGKIMPVRCLNTDVAYRYVVVFGAMEYLHMAEVEVFAKDNLVYSSCLEMLNKNRTMPSGEYSIRSSSGRAIKVYCEMGLDGGGYTFIKSSELLTLSNAELQALFTVKSNFLIRVMQQPYVQLYGVLGQTSNYKGVQLSVQLNANEGYTTPDNVNSIGPQYLYVGFLPDKLSPGLNETSGIQVNGRNIMYSKTNALPANYFALFPNYWELPPFNHNKQWTFFNDIIYALLPIPSGRMMPQDYFMQLEVKFEGEGCQVVSDGSTSSKGILGAAIGFK